MALTAAHEESDSRTAQEKTEVIAIPILRSITDITELLSSLKKRLKWVGFGRFTEKFGRLETKAKIRKKSSKFGRLGISGYCITCKIFIVMRTKDGCQSAILIPSINCNICIIS